MLEDKLKKKFIMYVNQTLKIEDIVQQHFDIRILPGTIYCPFISSHGGRDNNKSAKFYSESNSIYCFAEAKAYTPFKVLLEAGFTYDDILEKYGDEFRPELVVDKELKIVPDKFFEIQEYFRYIGKIDFREVVRLFSEHIKVEEKEK